MVFTSLLVTGLSLCQIQSIEWTVKDTLLPLEGKQDEAFAWGSRHPFGSPAGGGHLATLLGGQWIPNPGSSMQSRNYLLLTQEAEESFSFSTKYLSHGGAYDWGLLNSPLGLRFLAKGVFSSRRAGLVMIDLASGSVIGEIPVPPGIPGSYPGPGKFEELFPCGDQNGDGYDDFFWSTTLSSGAGYAYFGLIDGANFSSVWTHVEVGFTAAPAITWEPKPLPDFTGDGVSDFYVGVWRPLGLGISEHSWLLLSGADGAIVWREDNPGQAFSGTVIGKDYSGDLSPDAAIGEMDFLRLVSGKDGAEIWRTPWTVLSQALEPHWSIQGNGLGGLTFSKGLLANDSDIIVSPFLQVNLNTFASSLDFAIFSTSDGTLLGLASVPPDLSPWDSNILLNGSSFIPNYYSEPYGDFDNDGLMEYSIRARDEANSPAWAVSAGPNSYSQRLVILGQRTLFTEDTHDVLTPSPVTFNLICPSGPGKDFVVLLSTQFSERHGLTIGRWKTYLGASSALDMTIRSRALSGTLDAEGQGFTYAMVPPNPNLIGQTLYSRGLILNPAGSADPLWSMTSLGQTLLQ